LAPEKLQHRAARLAQGMFLGGPVGTFEAIGRLQLITLLRCGLYPDSRVLDLGCGSLRGGYWLVHFLQPDRYFGIEPNAAMLDVGRNEILGAELMAEKRPKFLTNDNFDPAEFGAEFDFFLARSIWTHASREQIRQMLDSFTLYGAGDGVFLTSYLPVEYGQTGYSDEGWVGRSHESDTRGVVRHELRWIESECRKRSFSLQELPVDRKRQVWLLIAKGEGATPMSTYLEDLISADATSNGLLRRLRKTVKRIFRYSSRHSSQ
jgi:SAM-dependent methyltransferase